MAKTVVGLFDTMEEAQGVVQDLINSGFSRNDISLVANDAKGQYKDYKASNSDSDTSRDAGGDDKGNNAGEGAGAGAVGGTVVGGVLGLLVGVGALAIPGIGPVVAAGTLATVLGSTALGAGIGAAAGGLIGALVGMGVPEEDAKYYSEGVRRGGALVTVNASDDKADTAYDIIQRHGAVDIDERGADWKQSGWQDFDANAKPYTAQEIDTSRSQARPANTTNRTNTQATTNRNTNTQGNEAVLPVVEEELQVGKRQVQRGGVRVYSRVEEKPVQEQVNLREERVNVDRRPVDRPVTDADRTAFKEGSYEVRTTAEEPVVSKQARVVEEVAINKDVQERNQTISDTVRRTDVEVEQLGAQPRTGTSATNYSTYDTDFRNHFNTNYANSGSTYDTYMPNYQYGYNLANDQRYANRNWAQIEPDVRRNWESQNPSGKWDQIKDSVRYAWDKASGGAKNATRGNTTDQNYRSQ